MTRPEYEKYFGRKRLAKDPKAVMVKVRGLSGKVEECFAFRDSTLPGKTLVLRSVTGEQRNCEVMAYQEHLHAAQGQEHFIATSTGRMSASDQKQLLQACPALVTVEEYYTKLHGEKPKHSVKRRGDDENDDSLQRVEPQNLSAILEETWEWDK